MQAILNTPTVVDTFSFSCEIDKGIGRIQEVIDWCKQELNEKWRWDIVEASGNTPGRYIFYFDNERSYLAFLLKWK